MTSYRMEEGRIEHWAIKRDGKTIGAMWERSTADERATVLAALQERASTHGQPRGMDRLAGMDADRFTRLLLTAAAKLDRIEALMRQIDAEDDDAECDRLWGELLGAIDS